MASLSLHLLKAATDSAAFSSWDSIGPDELRLTFDGVQLSKETLRKPYRSTPWLTAIDQAKALAKERVSETGNPSARTNSSHRLRRLSLSS